MNAELSRKAAQGVLWNLLNQFSQQLVQFVVVIILSRLLAPEDFGVFGMAVIFSTFFQTLRQWGYQAFLVQKKEIDGVYKDTAFWGIFFLSILTFLVCFLIAKPVSIFFHNSAVASVLRALSFTALLTPFGAVQWALVTRDLNFKILSIRNIIASIIYGLTACFFAFLNFGVWSLVISSLIREFVWSLLFWFLYDWRPKLRFSLVKLKEMTKFAFGCVGSGVLNYLINNVDGVFVGRFLGPNNLGQYNLATNLISQPQNKLVTHVTSVAFPMFSQLQDEREKLREYYVRIIRVILIVVTPLLAILLSSAYEFIITIYGEKWIAAVFPVQIMCVYGLIKSISSITEPVFLGLGRPGTLFRINLFRVVILIACVVLGVRYGLVGVSWAVLIYSITSTTPLLVGAHSQLKLSFKVVFKVFSRFASIFVVTVFLITLFNRMLLFSHPVQLVTNIFVGLVVYGYFLITWGREDLDLLIKLFQSSFLRAE